MQFKHTLNVDIETFSSVDLKKAGMYRYAESEDFEILMIAYSIDGGEVEIIDLKLDNEHCEPESQSWFTFAHALHSPDYKKIAYNAQFERICFEEFFCQPMPPEQWECTMIKGAMLGLPMGLGSIATVLQTETQKDYSGSALIRYFCLPCKPTKTNEFRTRNLPHHNPEKWQAFKSYCIDDVRAEMAVGSKIAFFDIPEKEKRLWDLDQWINGYGVLVDKKFVRQAIEMDATVKESLTAEAIELTGLDNPNSVSKLLTWLSVETGDELTTLRKADVPGMLKKYDDAQVTRVLEIRQEMAKTSVSKYLAMARSVCADGRIRGLFQFAGARTMRWAGRLVQMQNLPQNHLNDLDLARELVREGDLDSIEMGFGNVPDTLSQLIRTAFVAPKGKTFGVFDFSAIEARVIAWCANELWRLEVFATHGKIYEASASKMFSVPMESVTKGSDLRQKGKVAELACIAKGQLVLTDRGLVPIQDVKIVDKVFDGTRFCRHKGVIFKGIKKVITYEGLTATTDHLVWVEGQSEPIHFGVAAASGSRLLRTVSDWENLWESGSYKRREALDERLGASDGVDQMPDLRGNTMERYVQSFKGEIQGVSELLAAEADTEMVRPKIDCCKTTLRKSKSQRLPKLRGERNSVQIQIGVGSRTISARVISKSSKGFRIGSNQQQRALRAWKFALYNSSEKQSKQKGYRYERLEPQPLALLLQSRDALSTFRTDKGANYSASAKSGVGQTQELARDCREVEVYDIAYCGPNNRYVVSGALVHNCGYGGGTGALINMGAVKMGLKEEDLQGLIDAWRAANPSIVRFWKRCEQAAISAVEGQPVTLKDIGVRFFTKKNFLFIELPSGRRISYYKPHIKPGRFGGASVAYWGTDSLTKKWCVIDSYGGKWVENIVQAIARDCLAESLLAVAEHNYPIVFHVHDELVVELPCETADQDFHVIKNIMSRELPWAKGLPLTADGYLTKFYKKD